jgi:succinoglycan biosynthesis transport protein ExoP
MNRSLAPGHRPALPERRNELPARTAVAAPVPMLDPRLADGHDDDAPNLLGYWQILVKRKWLVISVLTTVLAIVLVKTLLTPSVFRASATLQIDQDTIKIIQSEGVAPAEGLGDRDYYQTQYELLRSRSLAERVATGMNAEQLQQHALAQNAPGLMARLFGDDAAANAEEPVALPAADTDALATYVQRHLSIDPVRNSRLVRIQFDSLDPAFSASMANAIADAFIATHIDRRFDASAYAKSYLEDRLQQLKLKLEDSEKQLVQFAQQQGIVSIDQQQSPAAQELQSINASLAAAQQQRIEAEAKFRRSQNTPGDALPEVLLSSIVGQLKNKRTELMSEYQEKLRIFKPGYPAMEQIKSQIDEIDRQLAGEVGRIKNSIRSEFDAARSAENMLGLRLTELKAQLLDLQGRSIQYNIIKREVDTNRELYDGLLQRYKEIGVAGGITANNISVVDRARAPQSRFSPNLSRNLLFGLLAGLAAGIFLALLFEHLDDTIKTPDDVEQKFGLAVLGVIPKILRGTPLEALKDPRSAFSESYRSVRTALQFSTEAGVPRTLFVTSSAPGEGKSTTALTLAMHFSQLGKRVLLIDADLRNPTLHHSLRVPNAGGLSNYLSGASRPLKFLHPTHVKNLACLCSGPLPPNPAELLAGPRMATLLRLASASFDQVIIDGPPVLGIADAAILSNLAGGTLVVVEAGSTRLGYARGVLKRLSAARARVLGVVLTKLDPRQGGTTYGYGDYGYYAYGGRPKLEAPRARRA